MPSEVGVSPISDSEVEEVAKIEKTTESISTNVGKVSSSNEIVERLFQLHGRLETLSWQLLWTRQPLLHFAG